MWNEDKYKHVYRQRASTSSTGLPCSVCPQPSPCTHWSSQASALTDPLLHLIPLFCKCLTHRPDDGGSNTSETLTNFYQITQHNIPEDSHHHTAVRTLNLTQDIMFHEASWLYTWDVLLGARTLNLPQSVLEKASGFWPFAFTALLVWTLLGGSKFFLALLAGLVTVGDAASDFFRRLSPAAAGWSSVSSRARRRLK
jgi:hypothetical protein